MDAYVVFDRRRTERRYLWHYLLPTYWTHCFLLLDDGSGSYPIVVDPLAFGVSVTLDDLKIDAEIESQRVRETTAIVKIPVREFTDKFYYRGILTCVSLIKAILGLRSPGVITPRGLFKLLLKSGGIVIWRNKNVKWNF